MQGLARIQKRIRKYGLRVVILGWALLFALCSPAGLLASSDTNKLVLGYEPFEPYLFEGQDETPRGIVKDLWELWSQKTGTRVEFIRLNSDQVNLAHKNQTVDGLAVIPPLVPAFALTKIPLPLSPIGIRLYKESSHEDGAKEMTGRLGILDKALLPSKVRGLPDTLLRFSDRSSIVKGALAGEVTAFIMEEDTASILLARKRAEKRFIPLEIPVFKRPVFCAFPDLTEELSDLIHSGFSRISAKEIDQLVAAWTGETREMVWRPHTRPLKIAASIDNMPFHFADESGRAVGMFIDLWELWSEKTGLPVEFIPVPWGKSLDMVRKGEADIHAGCFFSVQRDSYLDYASELRDCQTHFFFHESIYGLKELGDLKGFEIGVLDKDYAVEFVNREMPGAALKVYGSHQDLFKGVAAGEVKVFICDTPTALFFMTRENLISKYRYHPARPLYRKPFFAAVQEGNQTLLAQVNQGLDAISSDERARIERKWMGKDSNTDQDVIIIGVDQSFPPFSMRSANGEPSGLMVDFWQAWAEQAGEEISIQLMDRGSAVNALKDGRIDILTGIPPHKEVHGWVGFAQPHYRVDFYLYKPAGSGKNSIKDASDVLSGFKGKLGVLKDAMVEEWVLDLEPSPKVTGFDSSEQMILAAAQGQIAGFLATPQEMAILPGHLGLASSFIRSKSPVLNLKIRAGVRNYNPDLIQSVDSGFSRMGQEIRAEIEADWILEPGLRVFSSHTLKLSREEEEWLTRHKLSGKRLKVGLRQERPPFEFAGETAKYQGMAFDILGLLQQRLGFNLELVPPPWGPDVQITSSFSALSGNEEGWEPTRSYMEFPWVMITKSQSPMVTGLADLAGKTVAVEKVYAPYIQEHSRWDGINILWVASTAHGLEAVAGEKADLFVGNLAAAGYLIQTKAYTGLKVAGAAAMENDGLCFAVHKDIPHLKGIIDKGIASISRADLDQIRQKYFAVQFEQGVDMEAVRSIAIKVGLGVMVVFALVLLWNRLIRRREERFRCLTEQGSDIIQAFTANGRIIYASPSHSSVLGLDPKALKQTRVFEMIHPDDVEKFKAMLKEIVRSGDMATLAYRVNDAQGKSLWFESQCINLQENKAIKAFVINGRDITQTLAFQQELQSAKEDAETANQTKTDFLAGLSHEVRTPLNAILGMTESTLRSSLGEHQAKNLKAVLSSARHLKVVISDILDFSSLEAGKIIIRQKSFFLDNFLENLIHTWKIETEKKGLTFNHFISEDLPQSVISDQVRLGQILTNLLSNAVKFTSTGNIALHVFLAEPEEEISDGKIRGKQVLIAFSITDTGIGIAQEQLGPIFNRFAQARESITRQYGGTGLGLSISKDMAALMGGSLMAESQLGKGSCFTLTLPFEYETQKMRGGKEGWTGEIDLGGKSLLLAEDDPVNQAVFKEMILGTGCELVYANNGHQVIETLHSLDVDLVFMDIEMPEMDGLTATELIRQGRAGEDVKNIPIIAMTAHVLDEYRDRAKKSGMDGFLAKPLEREELITSLRAVFSASPVDHKGAVAALGGNEELAQKLNTIFLEQTPEVMKALGRAIEDRDLQGIGLAAHTLKGAGGRIFAKEAADRAAELEAMVKALGDTLLENSAPEWGKISRACDRTLRVFENVISYLK